MSILNNKELIELQKKYRKGIIREEDIPKDILKDLKELYHRQIKYLQESIEYDKKKILKIRKFI